MRSAISGCVASSAELLLVVAYIAMWLLFFGFMAMTHRRQKALTEKVERLEQALKRADSTGEVSAN